MKKLLLASAAIALLTFAGCAIVLAAHTVHLLDSWASVPDQLGGILDAVQKLPQNIIPLVTTPVLAEVDKQATGIRRDLVSVVRDFRTTADRRLGDALSRYDDTLQVLDQRSLSALLEVDAVRQDLQPTIGNLEKITAHTDRAVVDLHPQLLGLVAASKVTAGETAQTMRTFQAAVPGFLAQGQAIAGNVTRATVEFSGVAANLNRLTKPKWYDRLLGYGLSAGSMYRDLNPGFNAAQTVRGFFVRQK